MNRLSILSMVFAVALLFAFADAGRVSAQDFNIFLNTQECLDLENTGQQNSVRLIVAPCDTSSATQRFQVVGKFGTGFVNIKTGNNRCIEISAGQMGDGIDVTQFNCDNSAAQSIRLQNGAIPSSIVRVITGQISFSHSGKCLDASNRPWVQQFSCSNSQNQIFQIKPAPALSLKSQFLIKWDNEVSKKLPLSIGQVEFTDIISYCTIGCDCSEPDENEAVLFLSGWTPKLSAGPQRDAQAIAVKPALLPDYCSSGAVQQGINLDVQIWDMNKNNAFGNAFDFTITPNDCPVNSFTPTVSTEDQFWNSIVNSSNQQDFQNYLNNFGQNGKYAPIARLKMNQIAAATGAQNSGVEDQYWNNVKNSQNSNDFQSYLNTYPNGKYVSIANLRIRQLGGISTTTQTPTPTINSGTLSVEDQYWNTIKNSQNENDFQSYLNRFGQNGKYAPIADLRIRQLKANTAGNPNPPNTTGSPSVEDQYWDTIKNSQNANDFQGYLNNFPNGKYAPVARLKISRNPTPQSLEDQHWERIKNSQNPNDFQGYLNTFPNGKYAVQARSRKSLIEQQQETADFLKNAEFGSLSEISGFRKVYVTATDFNSRNRIVRELQKKIPSLIMVGNKQDADFFIEYKLAVTTVCDPGASTAAFACQLHTGTIWVHTIRLKNAGNAVNRILWNATKTKSYSETGVNLFDKNPAAQAAEDLVKELKKLIF